MKPSRDIKFKKGDVLTLSGPAEFPFELTVHVLSNTKNVPYHGHVRTPVAVSPVEPALSKRMYILHWSDVEYLTLMPPTRAYEESQDTELLIRAWELHTA